VVVEGVNSGESIQCPRTSHPSAEQKKGQLVEPAPSVTHSKLPPLRPRMTRQRGRIPWDCSR
jgi:hypothetical protein